MMYCSLKARERYDKIMSHAPEGERGSGERQYNVQETRRRRFDCRTER